MNSYTVFFTLKLNINELIEYNTDGSIFRIVNYNIGYWCNHYKSFIGPVPVLFNINSLALRSNEPSISIKPKCEPDSNQLLITSSRL